MKNSRQVQMFLDRLNWKANSGEIEKMTEFQVDIYKFQFKDFSGGLVREFAEYTKDLCMAYLGAIMLIWLWLHQHNVKFKMSFGWNPRLPVAYNLANLWIPRRLNRDLKKCNQDNLMKKISERMENMRPEFMEKGEE